MVHSVNGFRQNKRRNLAKLGNTGAELALETWREVFPPRTTYLKAGYRALSVAYTDACFENFVCLNFSISSGERASTSWSTRNKHHGHASGY